MGSIAVTAKSLLGRGIGATRLHRRALGRDGVVVAFHRVSDAIPEDALTRSSQAFDRFCRFFAAYFDVVPLAEIVSRLNSGRDLAGALAITFDDGYLDNFEVAAPILKRFDLPATFFVATRFIETTIVPWWDANLPRQPGWMSWTQVSEMAREGFDIGAHTRTHVDLGKVDGDAAKVEIEGSKQDLIDALGAAPRHFAYPYGRRDNLLDANRARVRAAGFQCCVSCHGGLALAGDDPLMLHRVPISTWYQSPAQLMFEVATRRA